MYIEKMHSSTVQECSYFLKELQWVSDDAATAHCWFLEMGCVYV